MNGFTDPAVRSGPAEGALANYLRALRVRWPLVLLVTLVALVGALAALTFLSPLYRATAQVLVTPIERNDETFQGISLLRDTGDPTRTIQTAAALLESPRAAELAAAKLGAGWNRDLVLEAVRIEPQGQSSVLSVIAQADSPQAAAALANEFTAASLSIRQASVQRQLGAAIDRLRASRDTEQRAAERRAAEQLAAAERAGSAGRAPPVFQPSPALADRLAALEVVRDSRRDPTLSSLQPALLPTKAVGAPPWMVVAASVFAGLLLGMLLAFVIELLDRRVRDQGELAALYPLPILAGIPRMSRRERRPSALPPLAVREAFRTLRVQLEQLGSGRTILLTSASSDEGKTNAAANLGFALVEAGHRVVLIDFDLRDPNLAGAVGIQPERRLVSALGSNGIQSSLVESPFAPGLLVLPAVEGDVAMLELVARRLPEILSEALDLPADYVIVDAAPLGELSDALGIAGQVDDVIVVARPGHTSRNGLQMMRGLLERTGVEPRGLVVMGETVSSSGGYRDHRPIARRDDDAAREDAGAVSGIGRR